MTQVEQLSLKPSTAEGWLLKSIPPLVSLPCTDWMGPCLERVSCDRDHWYRKSWEAPSWHYLMGLGRRDPLGSSDFWHLLARLELSGWSMVEACFAVAMMPWGSGGPGCWAHCYRAKGCWAHTRLWVLPTRGHGSQRCSLPFRDPSREDTDLVFPMVLEVAF